MQGLADHERSVTEGHLKWTGTSDEGEGGLRITEGPDFIGDLLRVGNGFWLTLATSQNTIAIIFSDSLVHGLEIAMRLLTLALSVLLCSPRLMPQSSQPDTAKSSKVVDSAYVPVHSFDSKRDAESDIKAAIAEAQRTGKRILLDIGGDWCQYCNQMDDFFRVHPELLQLRDDKFLTVAIYYGDDNKNKPALSQYSKVLGIPHFFVLEKDGTLLHSQHVLDLRQGGDYDANKMKRFLLAWAPSTTSAKP